MSADWKSPSKIIARTGPGKGKGDIIVITKSGGQGTCTVGFKGYHVQIGRNCIKVGFMKEPLLKLGEVGHAIG